MKIFKNIFFGIIFFSSSISLAQKPLELNFRSFEMELIVNNKIVEHKSVGTNCTFKYKYREKKYMFNYTHNVNQKRLGLAFKFIEKKNNQTYVKLYSLIDDKSIFVVKDSLYQRGKIEFINTTQEESGDVVRFIYRFSDKL